MPAHQGTLNVDLGDRTWPNPQHSEPSGSGDGSQTTTMTAQAARRRAHLVSDPHASLIDEHNVQCLKCGMKIKLSLKGMYDLHHWEKHRKRCNKWSEAYAAQKRAENCIVCIPLQLLWCAFCMLTRTYAGVIATVDASTHTAVDRRLRDGVHGDERQEHQPSDPQRKVPHPGGGPEGGEREGEGACHSHTHTGSGDHGVSFPRSTATSGSRGVQGGTRREKDGVAGAAEVPAELTHAERGGDGAAAPRPRGARPQQAPPGSPRVVVGGHQAGHHRVPLHGLGARERTAVRGGLGRVRDGGSGGRGCYRRKR